MMEREISHELSSGIAPCGINKLTPTKEQRQTLSLGKALGVKNNAQFASDLQDLERPPTRAEECSSEIVVLTTTLSDWIINVKENTLLI